MTLLSAESTLPSIPLGAFAMSGTIAFLAASRCYTMTRERKWRFHEVFRGRFPRDGPSRDELTGVTMIEEELRKLIESAQRGDRQAFEALVREYRPRMERVIRSRWRVGEGDLDDIIQESLLRAYQALERFEWHGTDSFFGWVSGTAMNVTREFAKKRRLATVKDFEGHPEAGSVSQSCAMRRQERFQRLETALDALPSAYREVIQLVRLEGLSVKEVAQRLNKTPNAVSRMIYRASRQLRETFGDTESLSLPMRPIPRTGGHDDA